MQEYLHYRPDSFLFDMINELIYFFSWNLLHSSHTFSLDTSAVHWHKLKNPLISLWKASPIFSPCIWNVLQNPDFITTSWELWKHPDPVSGGRPIFFKPEWPKESKNGFKTISCCPPYYWFFQKTVFRKKKLSKKFVGLLIFEFLWQYIWTN